MDLQFVLALKDHPTLAAGLEAHEKGKASFNERAEFLSRSLKNLHQEAQAYEDEFWKNVAIYAKEKEILPTDFKEEEHCFHYKEKFKQIFMHDKNEHKQHPLEALLGLLGKEP